MLQATTVRQPKRCLHISLMSLAMLLSSQAFAHAGHNDLIQLRVNEQQLKVDIGLNASDFMQFDTNHDQQLTRAEFVEQQTVIKQWLQTQIEVKAGQLSLQPSWFDLPLELETKDLSSIKHVRLIQHYALPTQVEVKFQSKLPSFKGKGLVFSSDEHFYIRNLNSSPVEIVVQAAKTE